MVLKGQAAQAKLRGKLHMLLHGNFDHHVLDPDSPEQQNPHT